MDGSLAAARRRKPLRRADIPAQARRASSTGAVLRAVLEHGPVARSTVARLTGLSPASVTGLCAELIAGGLLREAPEAAGPRGMGRPHIPVDIDTGRHLVAGAHVAVPHTTLALMDLRGRIVAQERLPRPERGSTPAEDLARLAGGLPRLLARHGGGRTVRGLGLATGGWVDQGSGVIVEHPLLGWQDVPARDLLGAATGLPVRVDGHSRALIRAEQLFGEVRTRVSVVQLFIGNVVDAAFATAGAVHQGPRFAAGTVAHLPVEQSNEPCACGRSGCLEATVSERTTVRRAVEQGIVAARAEGAAPAEGAALADGPATIGAVLAAAEGGDVRALALFRERARLVGRAAALLLDVLDPELLMVVEPGVSRLPECLAELRAEVAARSRVCADPERTVLPTSFPGSALATAGGAIALDALFS